MAPKKTKTELTKADNAFWSRSQDVSLLAPQDGETRVIQLVDPVTGEVHAYNVTYGQSAPKRAPWFTQEELRIGVHLQLGEFRILNTAVTEDGEFPVRVCVDLLSGEERYLALTYSLKDVFTGKHEGQAFYIRELESIRLDGGRVLRDYEIRPLQISLVV